MENPAEVGRWVKAQRQRKGWSAQELADRARGFAVEEGVTLKLTQQSVSNFELGEAKRLPVWLRYIHKAFSAADGRPVRTRTSPSTARIPRR